MAASLPEIPPQPCPGSDQDKLIWALKTILLMLHAIVGEERLFPSKLRGLFLETWSGAVKSVGDAIEIILFSYEGMVSSLTPIGLTGKSLALKTAVLEMSAKGLFGTFSLRAEPRYLNSLIFWLHPATKSMSAILRNLATLVDELEVARDYSEQVEIAIEIIAISLRS